MGMQRAADARWSIGGTFFAVQKYSRQTTTQRIDVSNTESIPGNENVAFGLAGFGGPTSSFIPEIPVTEISLTSASYDPLNNPMAPPWNIIKGAYLVVAWFPAGINNVGYGPYNAMVERISHGGTVGQGAQPFDVVLVLDGEFFVDIQSQG
jgi:hypothetical protein